MDGLNKQLLNYMYLLIALMIFLLIIGCILGCKEKEHEKYINSDEYKQLIEKQEKCNHNYVTTSRGFGRGLHIYSVCTKCNKEI